MRQSALSFGETWVYVKDGDPTAKSIFDGHYSRYRYADGREPKLFVGPGQKVVLITPCARALLVWRKFRSADEKQLGVNCAVFRNEGAGLSSKLLCDGMMVAHRRWPGERLYTYVNPTAIRSVNPGFCFLKAGWRRCGVSKRRKLLILEFMPNEA